MESTSPLSPVMSDFFLDDCRVSLKSGGISLEDQEILLNGCAALRDRVLELENEILHGRPEVFEAMAIEVASAARSAMSPSCTGMDRRILDRCIWDAMLDRGFRGPDIRQRAFAIVFEMIRAEKS